MRAAGSGVGRQWPEVQKRGFGQVHGPRLLGVGVTAPGGEPVRSPAGQGVSLGWSPGLSVSAVRVYAQIPPQTQSLFGSLPVFAQGPVALGFLPPRPRTAAGSLWFLAAPRLGSTAPVQREWLAPWGHRDRRWLWSREGAAVRDADPRMGCGPSAGWAVPTPAQVRRAVRALVAGSRDSGPPGR